MKWIAVFALCISAPIMAHAFGAGPELRRNGFEIDSAKISVCVDDIAAESTGRFVPDAEAACAGLGFDICTYEGAPVEFSRVSALSCLSLQKEYWEWRLARAVDGLSGAEAPAEFVESLRNTTPELEATVRMWRAYSEAKCSYFTSEYGVGASRGREGDIVEWACLSDETAGFALEMEARLRAHCDIQKAALYGSACEFGQ